MSNPIFTTTFAHKYSMISASYSIGQSSPIFSIVVPVETPESSSRVFGGPEGAYANIQSIEPSAPITITMFGLSWECEWSDAPYSVSPDGSVRTIEFVPKIMLDQVRPGYGQDIYFYSVPQWMYDKISKDIDDELCEVHHKESDGYPTNGYTTQEIIEIMSGYADIPYIVSIPTCHVPEKTVTYNAGDPYLNFIESLLLSDFDHVIFASDGNVIITCIEPDPSTNTYPAFKGTTANIAGSRKNKSPYDAFHFVGGDTKPVLEDYAFDSIKYYEPDQEKVGEWIERQETRGDDEVTVKTRETTQLDPFEETFCLLKTEEIILGAIPQRANPETKLDVTLEESTTTYEYENSQSLLYESARFLKATTIKAGYCYKYLNEYQAPAYGITYYLTEDLTVIDSTEYDVAETKPSILASAYLATIPFGSISDYISTKIHEMTYAADTEAAKDPDVTEGMILTDIETTEEYGADISAYVGITEGETTRYSTRECGWFSCQESPRNVLLNIASQLQGADEITGTIISMKSQATSSRKVSYRKIDNAMFEYKIDSGEYDSQTKIMQTQTHRNNIPSAKVPSVPTELRMQTLQVKTGELGSKATVVSKRFSIPTANRGDFAIIQAMLEQKTANEFDPITYTSIEKNDFVLPGYNFNGRPSIGFTIVESSDAGYDISITTL